MDAKPYVSAVPEPRADRPAGVTFEVEVSLMSAYVAAYRAARDWPTPLTAELLRAARAAILASGETEEDLAALDERAERVDAPITASRKRLEGYRAAREKISAGGDAA